MGKLSSRFSSIPLLLLAGLFTSSAFGQSAVPASTSGSPRQVSSSTGPNETTAELASPPEKSIPLGEGPRTETGRVDPDPDDSEDARSEAEAKAAFRRGDRLYLEGDYQGAVDAFEEAYAKSGRIEMLFNLANAYERLGNYSEAALSLRGYIPHSPTDNRPALERRLARLEDLAEQKRRRPPPRTAVTTTPAPSEPPFPWDRGLGIGLTTLGVAGIITGTAFAVSASAARRELDELCVDGASGRLCTSEADPLLQRDKAHSLVADVALLGGIALTATGIALIVHSTSKKTEVRASIGPRSLWLRGTF